jgi:hypothetical protein
MALQRVQRGQPISANLVNSIIDEINKNNLISVVGGKMSKSINGTTIAVGSARVSGEPAIDPPFNYSSVATSSSGAWFRLSPGTINNYIPDNNFETLLLSATTPTETSLNYVSVLCDTDGYNVISASIISSNVAPLAPPVNEGSAPVTFSALIYTVKGFTPYRVIGPSSLVARVTEAGRDPKVSFGIGEIPFNIWYTWTIFT